MTEGTTTASANPLRVISRTIGAISTLCGIIAATLILVSVIVTCQMIFVRFVLGVSTIWQTEFVTYMMIGATLIGLPYVQKLRGHVNVDLVPNLLPAGARRVLMAGVALLSVAVLAVMAYYGYELFHLAYVRGWTSDTVWGPPLWIPYVTLPVGFGLFILQLLADILDALDGRDL